MDKSNKLHLERLKELASNFDYEERMVVLSCISDEEIKAHLNKKEARTIE